MGRVDYHYGRVSGHNGPVTDLKWNPFNDNVIATSSDDCTVNGILIFITFYLNILNFIDELVVSIGLTGTIVGLF